MSRTAIVSTVIASAAIVLASAILTAGPLDPPAGPIAPSYKTLHDVEPRTVINAANTPGNASALHVISQPGSYYLAGDLVNSTTRHSIQITVDHVSIDLNGFSIRGTSASNSGIVTSGSRKNIAIRNGTIHGHGNSGISLGNAVNVAISDIVASANSLTGVAPGQRAILSNVVCEGGNLGFNLSFAADSVLSRCVATNINGDGFGFTAARVIFDQCVASGSINGFVLGNQNQASSCISVGNSGYGVYVTGSRAVLTDCVTESNSFSGYYVGGPGARLTRCTAANNGNATATKYSGILIDALNAEIAGCTAIGNGRAGFQLNLGRATIRDSIAVANAGRGIEATQFANATVRVYGSRLQLNAIGAEVGPESIFENCAVIENIDSGILVTGNGNAIIRSCQFNRNGTIAISIGNGSVVEDCVFNANVNNAIVGGTLNIIRRSTFDTNGTAAGNNHPHISLNGAGNLIEDNYFFNGDSAIAISIGGGSIVRRNICNGTANNYGLIVPGNRVATINTSATLLTTNPNDNFSY